MTDLATIEAFLYREASFLDRPTWIAGLSSTPMMPITGFPRPKIRSTLSIMSLIFMMTG